MNIIKATAQFFSLNKYLRKSGSKPVGYFSWLHVTSGLFVKAKINLDKLKFAKKRGLTITNKQ